MELGEQQSALLAHAERQTKALESIVNLLWFFVALGVLAGALLAISL